MSTPSNNLGRQLGGGVARLVDRSPLERGTCKNHFHCAPAAAAVVPAFIRKATAPGVQTALVVGVPGQPLTTPARSNSRHHFSQGEVMPDLDLDNDETAWHWHQDQA